MLGGTLNLSSGVDNTLTMVSTATTPYVTSLLLNNGLVDLKGNNQVLGNLYTNNAIAGAGGVITNSSGTLAVLTSAYAADRSFAGSITGNLAFTRSGNNTTTLTNTNSYTGATIVRGGVLELKDQGALTATTSLTDYFGTLQLNDQGLNSGINRLATTVPLTLAGATLNYLGNQTSASVGTVNVSAGQSVVSVSTMTGNVAVSGLTLGNLVRATGGEVNFSGTNLGQNGFATTQVFLNQVNGGSTVSSLSNGILGGWATVNGTDFAGYVTSNGTQGGVGALNTLGFPYYSANLLSGTTAIADNINVNATVTMAAGAKTINSLRIAGAYNLTIGTTDTLTLSTGGLLANGASTISGGTITSGTSELFAYTNAAVTISSVLSGTGVSLVKGGASTLTLSGTNTFTGTLYANQGTTTLNATGANGTTIVAAGGDLVLNNAAVINQSAPLWEVTAGEFDEVMTINVGGTASVLRHFLPVMIDAGEPAVIVNFSSGWGRSTAPEVAPYCASKWAVEGLTQAVAQEVPPFIGVVAFNPGVIHTAMLESCFGRGAASYPEPEDWARAAVPFLANLRPSDNGKALTSP